MAALIAGVLWQPVRLIRECRGRCLPGGAKRAQSAVGDEKKQLIDEHRKSMTRLYYGCCLGPAWFRIPSWLGLASPGSNFQFVGIIPPIVCINVAIRTYENKSFF
jgi:hypothetical protein